MFGPWHKPARDPHADRVEAVASGGLGGSRPPPERASLGMVIALAAGVGLPAIALFALYGVAFAIAAVTVGCVVVGLAWKRSIDAARRAAARARSRDEARAHEAS